MHRYYSLLLTGLLFCFSVNAQELQASLQQAHVRLQWTSKSNTPVDHYELESRTRGTEFKTKALILAEEEMETRLYLYKDKLSGIDQHIYYRLHIFYTDGTEGYSNILTVSTADEKEELLKISTDISQCKLTMELPGSNGSYLFRIYNMNGQLLDTHRSVAGSCEIPADKLSAGKYFMEAFHPLSGKRLYGTFSL